MSITVAVTMVKDELDILPYTLQMMTSQVDALVIADNMSTDGTWEWLQTFANSCRFPMVICRDPEVGYYQSAKMTGLARVARETFNAEWIVPFDADEVWVAGSRTIKELLSEREIGEWVVPARLYDHMATGDDEPSDPNPIRRMPWRRPAQAVLPKVACRWDESLTIEMGNHGATYDFEPGKTAALLEIHHFPYRSVEQVLRKTKNGAEAYKATDLDEKYGAHWRQWGKAIEHNGDDWITEMYYKYYWRNLPREVIKIDGEYQPKLYWSPVWPAA